MISFIKTLVIIWLASSLFIDSAQTDSKVSWKDRIKTFFMKIIAPWGLIRTAYLRIKNMIK